MTSPLTCVLAGWLGVLRHQVAVARLLNDGHGVVTGSQHGHIWLWRIKEGLDIAFLRPHMLLVGHTAPITALQQCRVETDAGEVDALVSASEDGTLAVWSLDDGQCINVSVRAFPSQPRRLQLLTNAKQILVCGNYTDVIVYDLTTLEAVSALVQPNWVIYANIQPLTAQNTDYVFTISVDGLLRSWPLQDALDRRDMMPLREQRTEIFDALDFTINPFNRSMLVVLTQQSCQIFDSSTFRLLLVLNPEGTESSGSLQSSLSTVEAPPTFSGMTYLDADTILLWNTCGRGFVYRMPQLSFSDSVTVAYVAKGMISTAQERKREQMQTQMAMKNPEPKPALMVTLDRNSQAEACVRTHFLNLIPAKVTIAKALTQAAVASKPVDSFYRFVAFSITANAVETVTMWSFSVPPGHPNSAQHIPTCLQPVWETTMSNLWQIPMQSSWRPSDQMPSAVNVVRGQWFVQGFYNGDIRITLVDNFGRRTPVSPNTSPALLAQSSLPNSSTGIKTLKGHTGKITCFASPDVPNKNYLLSGSADQTVRIWNIDTGDLLNTFQAHTGEVTAFVAFPRDLGMRIKGHVCSVGRDNALAIISMDEMKCLYLLGGHPYPIVSIHWRVRDDVLIVKCTDGTIYIWQMGTGHLDRRISGHLAAEILRGCDGMLSILQEIDLPISFDSAEVLRSTPVMVEGTMSISPLAEVLTFNLRRLLSAVQTNANATDEDMATLKSSSRVNDQMMLVQNAAAAAAGELSSEEQIKTQPVANLSSLLSLVQVVASALLDWGLQSDLDKLCADKLGMHQLPPNITIGTRGFNGFLSLVAPGVIQPGEEWDISGVLTAHRQLLIVALTKALIAVKGLEEESNVIMTHYCALLPDKLPLGRYQPPSLPYLATYWQDPLNDIQQAARSLFGSTLARMSNGEINSLVQYWASYLPYGNTNKRGRPISALILGAVGVDKASSLPERFRSQVAQSIVSIIMDESRGQLRSACTDLLGRGYSVWAKYVNESQILRILFSNAYALPPAPSRPLSMTSFPPSQPGGNITSVGLPSNTTPQSSPVRRASSQRQAAPSTSRVLSSQHSGFTSLSSLNSPPPSSSAIASIRAAVFGQGSSGAIQSTTLPGISDSALVVPVVATPAQPTMAQLQTQASTMNLQQQNLRRASRQALVLVASAVPKEFVNFLLAEKLASKQDSDRLGALKLISHIIKRRPLTLYEYLDRIVEVILRSLDPMSGHSLRDSLMHPTTITLRDLVDVYPFISFHRGSQRLALGTLDGCIILYDVRTGTRLQVYEGHHSSVSAVAISPDGKIVAGYFSADGSLRLWPTAQAFLASMIGGSSRMIGSVALTSPAVKPPASIIETVSLEWVTPVRLVLTIESTEHTIEVPSIQ